MHATEVCMLHVRISLAQQDVSECDCMSVMSYRAMSAGLCL